MAKKFAFNEVRWGIIGCGDVTEVKSGPALSLIKDSSLVAVMRRNGEKAADYAQRHHVPHWFDDAEKLIHHPEVNAIYVATPPDSHAEYTIMAARAGKPVYVEKPMARTTGECEQMIGACTEAGVPLYVAYYRRQLPNFLKVKELVDRGAVGEVRLVNIRLYQEASPPIVANLDQNWRVNPDIAGGGYFFDLASHQLDYLDYLFGPVKDVSGFSDNQAGLYQAEDIVSGSFRFEKGVMGSGLWCFSVANGEGLEQTEIIGSKGKITFSYFTSSNVVLENEDGRQEFTFEMPKHIQQPLIQTVVDDLLGRGVCPSTGESGIRTNRVMEAMTGN